MGKKLNSVEKKKCLYVGLLIGLIVLAAIIASSFSRDSQAYQAYFNSFGTSNWNSVSTEMFQKELFFVVVSKLLYKSEIDAIFLFLIFSIISLTVKFYLINKHSKDRLLSLTFFVSYFYLLHDSTQIRFSAAIACVYMGLHFLAENKKLLFVMSVIFSAIMFHIVSLVFILLLFFTTQKSWFWVCGMVVVAIVLYPVNINDILLNIIKDTVNYFGVQNTIFDRLYSYLLKPSSDIFLGIFSRSAMLVYLCAIVIFQYRGRFSAYEILCYNAFTLSIFFYILLKDSVDLQVRIRDLFGFSLVFLMPYIHRGMSMYVGCRSAYIILYLYLCVHLIKFAFYDKMLIF